MKRPKLAAVSSSMAAFLVIAGSCGIAGLSGATPAAAASGNSTGVTSNTITVGGLMSSSLYGDAQAGAQARIDRANASGGVNGRKIILETASDDAESPTTNKDEAQQLVENDKVFAVLPVITQTFGGADYLQAQGVPFFGWGFTPDWCNKSMAFGWDGNVCPPSSTPEIYSAAPAAARLFKGGSAVGKTVAIQGEDDASSSDSTKTYAAMFKADGAKVVLDANSIAPAPAVTSDFTPYAQKIMTSASGGPPDMVITLNAPGSALGLSQKLQQLGYKGIILSLILYDPTLVSTTKGITTQLYLEPFESTTPAAQAQMLKDFATYEPKTPHSLAALVGYWSANLFIAMAQKAGHNLTRQSLVAVAAHNFTYGSAAGAPPLVEYPSAKTHLMSCFEYVESNGKAYHVTAPMDCTPHLIKNPLYKKS
jgi:branched-chain amino acid transport system substrate-binding protein